MADYLLFDDGAAYILDHGLSGTGEFALSAKPTTGTGAHAAADKLQPGVTGRGIGEITGSGYSAIFQSLPAAAGRFKNFTQVEWRTEAHTDWQNAKSIVLIVGTIAVVAWDLRTGGAARALNISNTIERVAPTYQLTG